MHGGGAEQTKIQIMLMVAMMELRSIVISYIHTNVLSEEAAFIVNVSNNAL